MAIYGYSRVSTNRQADEGESLDVQQRTIEGYAMMHAFTVDRLFVERAVSGSVPLADRPAGAEILALVRPGDVVITAKLDRMFRSALDALAVLSKLQAAGVSLHMIDLGGDVTGNGISKLVFTILSAVAEAERDRIRERVSQMKADQRQRGRYLGGIPPVGFMVGPGGGLVADAACQEVIQMARRLHSEGVSFRLCQAAMATAGYPVSLGAVHRLLTSPAVVAVAA